MIEIDDTSIEGITRNIPSKSKDTEAQKLEGELTYKELTEALRHMKNSKSPGNGGFSAEIFKTIGSIWNICFRICELCI